MKAFVLFAPTARLLFYALIANTQLFGNWLQLSCRHNLLGWFWLGNWSGSDAQAVIM